MEENKIHKSLKVGDVVLYRKDDETYKLGLIRVSFDFKDSYIVEFLDGGCVTREEMLESQLYERFALKPIIEKFVRKLNAKTKRMSVNDKVAVRTLRKSQDGRERIAYIPAIIESIKDDESCPGWDEYDVTMLDATDELGEHKAIKRRVVNRFGFISKDEAMRINTDVVSNEEITDAAYKIIQCAIATRKAQKP